jgi:predicted transcriptional regulator
MTTITFDASESLAQELQYFAQTKQKSLNAFLIDALQTYLNSQEDLDDLALIKARENEPCSSLEDVVMRLKANGKI